MKLKYSEKDSRVMPQWFGQFVRYRFRPKSLLFCGPTGNRLNRLNHTVAIGNNTGKLQIKWYKMDPIRVISIDMFQTLVDVGSMRFHFWRQILGEKYSKDLVALYGGQWRELFPDHFKEAIENADGFVNVQKIFEGYWDLLFRKFEIDFDPVDARRVHFEIHRLAPPYADAENFVDEMKKHYPVCLVTDSDEDMVRPHLERFSFDRVFISERLRAYKGDPENRMFAAVIDHYGVSPHKIIHIGDMHTDILGAKQAGIQACWLNRDHQDWRYPIKPDYEVSTLDEAVEIVGQPMK